MPFRFPLAKVLLVKESVKKQEERALQKILLDMSRVAHQIEKLSAEIAEAHIAVERALQQTTPASELQHHFLRAQRAAEDRKTLVRELHALDQNRERQAEIYHAAHHKREVLVDLQDKQKDQYEQEQTRLEQKQMDDVVMARHPRN